MFAIGLILLVIGFGGYLVFTPWPWRSRRDAFPFLALIGMLLMLISISIWSWRTLP